MHVAPPTIGQAQPSYRAVCPVTIEIPSASHVRWNASQRSVSPSSSSSGGRLRSTAIHRRGRPEVAASDARMWTANQAARSQPYVGTTKTGSVVSAIATPSATRTTPTSTPCFGGVRTSASAAPSRRRRTRSKSSGVAFPVTCWDMSASSSLERAVDDTDELPRRRDRVGSGRDRRDHRHAGGSGIDDRRRVGGVDPADPHYRERTSICDGSDEGEAARVGFRLGRGRPHGHPDVVRSELFGLAGLRRIVDAHPEDALRPESEASPRRVVLATDVGTPGRRPKDTEERRQRWRRYFATARSRRNFFQSLVLVEKSTSVTICRTPIPAVASTAQAGALVAGASATATNGAILVAIAPDAWNQARIEGSARR